MKVEILSTELIKPYTSTPLSLRHYNISLLDELSPTMNVPTILYYPVDIHSCGKQYQESKMEVEILSTELIKPYTSTPLSLRHYNISLIDELSPTINVPTILYYPVDIHSCGKENVTTHSICMHLKKSLSMALTRFYPFAGRYMKESYMVDCSDQGAEFVQAQVDIRLDQLIGLGKNVQVELLNCLLPRPVGACDKDTDPQLAVQVSAFACGGYAIGILSSHIIADMSTTSSFVVEWAREAKQLLEGLDHDHDHDLSVSPSWNSAMLFPGCKLPRLPPRFSVDHKIVTKVFSFSDSAILKIREKARLDSSSEKLPTRVQSVFGILGKAIVDINCVIPGRPKRFLVSQTVNMRGRTDPPISKKQCGNLYLVASARSVAGEAGVDLQSLVELLTDSVRRELANCKKIVPSKGEKMMITPGFNELGKAFADPEISSVVMFSDWCKFPLYEADFGWGKPGWVSGVHVPMPNIVYLLRDRSGEGIEAWVNLSVDDMAKLEQDANIMEFTS
nr:PREDICTED: pelargonidin 3-O-(6-caffeoylglucoside) 5-O-(6-O-malonylglucoside) 4'''-malonyltransferase-like [Daucus carota subsp. sativus]